MSRLPSPRTECKAPRPARITPKTLACLAHGHPINVCVQPVSSKTLGSQGMGRDLLLGRGRSKVGGDWGGSGVGEGRGRGWG